MKLIKNALVTHLLLNIPFTALARPSQPNVGSDCSTRSYDELLVGVRGELNPRRKDMVGRAFKVLDRTGDGVVTIHDVEGRFNAKTHPDVIAGNKTPQEVCGADLVVVGVGM